MSEPTGTLDAPESYGKLFAAAPELLEALEDLVLYGGTKISMGIGLDKARAAIAKAKGKTE